MKAMAYRGRRRERTMTADRVNSAAACIGELSKHCEIFGFTGGQFSLFDIVETVLAKTGPADVIISVWTAAGADTAKAKEFVMNGHIRKIRWLLDDSFLTRQPEYCKLLSDEFGDCIRSMKIHCKFVVVQNEQWDFVVRTSMNLNHNPRTENFEISEDHEFAEFFRTFVDTVFGTIGEDELWNQKGDKFARVATAPEKATNGPETVTGSYSARMLKIKEEKAVSEASVAGERATMERLKRQKLEGALIEADKARAFGRAAINLACAACRPKIDQANKKFFGA